MYLTEFLKPRSLFQPGNGHVISTDYESISVTIKKSLTQEKGTLTFVVPAGAVAGNTYSIDFAFNKILENTTQEMFDYNQQYTINVELPSPLPASPNDYVAKYVAQHPAFMPNVVTSTTNNVVTYSVILPGVRLAMSSATGNLVTRATTQTATNGSAPNVGAGSAVFYRPEDNTMKPGVKALFGTTGYANTSIVPRWFGVLRESDYIQDKGMANLQASTIRELCAEVVRKGTVQIPLEQNAPGTLPANIGIVARFAPDGAFTLTGGFRIVDAGAAGFTPPVGTVLVPRSELISISPDLKSAIIKMF